MADEEASTNPERTARAVTVENELLKVEMETGEVYFASAPPSLADMGAEEVYSISGEGSEPVKIRFPDRGIELKLDR